MSHTTSRTIRDERSDPRLSYERMRRAKKAAEGRYGVRRVADNQTAQRTPFPSGDPRSEDSEKVSFNELSEEVQGLLSATGVIASAGVDVLPYDPSVALRNVVYWDSATLKVKPASAISDTTMPVLGLVKSLGVVGVGLAEVQFNTVLAGFVGLVPEKVYIVSRTAGNILRIDDTLNPDYPQVNNFRQAVGLAITTTQLLVRVHLDMVKL